MLYDQGSVCHLTIIGELFIASVIVLYDNSSCAFFILLFQLLAALVGAIGFLYTLGSLVQFSLFGICEESLLILRICDILWHYTDLLKSILKSLLQMDIESCWRHAEIRSIVWLREEDWAKKQMDHDPVLNS